MFILKANSLLFMCCYVCSFIHVWITFEVIWLKCKQCWGKWESCAVQMRSILRICWCTYFTQWIMTDVRTALRAVRMTNCEWCLGRGSGLTVCHGCTGAPTFFFFGAPAQKFGALRFFNRTASHRSFTCALLGGNCWPFRQYSFVND